MSPPPSSGAIAVKTCQSVSPIVFPGFSQAWTIRQPLGRAVSPRWPPGKEKSAEAAQVGDQRLAVTFYLFVEFGGYVLIRGAAAAYGI